jgi:hypothetical protein
MSTSTSSVSDCNQSFSSLRKSVKYTKRLITNEDDFLALYMADPFFK